MIEIGTAAASDIPELVRLRLAYFDEEFGTLPPEKLTAIREQLPLYFTAHLNRDCFCYTAKADGTAHACACAILCVTEKPANPHFPNGKTGYVLGVFTEQEYRGQGCATRIMQHLIADAKRLGLDLVTLSASDMGRPIYEKLGFTVSHSKFTEMELEIEK